MYHVHKHSSWHHSFWGWWNGLSIKNQYLKNIFLLIFPWKICWFFHEIKNFLNYNLQRVPPLKIITSENLLFKTQFKPFLFTLYLRFKFLFFNHSTNFESLISWLVFPYKDELIFAYIIWIVNHLAMKLDQITDIVMGNSFREYLAWFGGQGCKFRPFLICQRLQIIINQFLFLRCALR